MKLPLTVSVSVFAAAMMCAAMIGCRSEAADSSVRPVMAEASDKSEKKSGTALWSENCMRCHYARPSTQYSAQQWDIIVHHMRLRANFTGEEQRKITEFLQAGS